MKFVTARRVIITATIGAACVGGGALVGTLVSGASPDSGGSATDRPNLPPAIPKESAGLPGTSVKCPNGMVIEVHSDKPSPAQVPVLDHAGNIVGTISSADLVCPPDPNAPGASVVDANQKLVGYEVPQYGFVDVATASDPAKFAEYKAQMDQQLTEYKATHPAATP